MAWTTLDTNTLLPGEPWTSGKALAVYENPIAIAEGAAGAPRIEDAALDTTVTTAGETWVQNRIAASAVGDVGTWGMFRWEGASGNIIPGNTVSGSDLTYTNAIGTNSAIQPAGTWRCMGYAETTSDAIRVTVFMRIS